MSFAVWQATVVDDLGNIEPDALVTVHHATPGNPVALLYEDRAGTVIKPNPFRTDAEGLARFYAEGGAYRITATKGGRTRIWENVAIGTAAEFDTVDTNAIFRVEAIATTNRNIANMQPGVVIDDYTLKVGDRLLLAGQSNPAFNGVYLIQLTGAAIRHPAFSTYDDYPGGYYSVISGTEAAGTLWRVVSGSGGTIDSDPIIIEEFTGAESLLYVARDGSLPMQADLNMDGNNIIGVAGSLDPNAAAAMWQLTAGLAPKFEGLNVQAFYTTGTYFPTPGMKFCLVIVTGGGGGGAGVNADSTGNRRLAGGGGGAGGTSIGLFDADTIGPSRGVSVGARGAAGAAASGVAGRGGNGGVTNFGPFLSAPGGFGGSEIQPGSPPAQAGDGGRGGSTFGGTMPLFNLIGGDGGKGSASSWIQSGAGGSSFWGGGGGAVGVLDQTGAMAGLPGRVFGSGGSGAASYNATQAAGSLGGAGVAFILEFL